MPVDPNRKSTSGSVKTNNGIEQNGNESQDTSKINSNSFKIEVGKNIKGETLSNREAYFAQYEGLNDIDKIAEADDSDKSSKNSENFKEKNKEAIIKLLLDDLGSKNISMTEKERSVAVQKVQKFFEKDGASLKEKFGITLVKNDQNNSEIKIGDQTFEKIECGGGGDCCFKSIAEAIGYGKDNYMKVREELAKKEIEMAERKDKLPESLRYILKGVYGIDPEDDESCREALKQHAENITKKEGKWGELIDVCFVPLLTGQNNKKVFAFREFFSEEDKSLNKDKSLEKDKGKDKSVLYRCYAGDGKCNGLSEGTKPKEGDVVLLNINNAHWQMLKLKE